MQSFSKDDMTRIETVSKTNLEKMCEIQDYLINKINWVIKICNSWMSKLDFLEENNKNYLNSLQKILDYVPSEIVSDDFRNIHVSPEFSKIGVVMTNLAKEKHRMETEFVDGFIKPVKEQFNLLKDYQTIITNTVIQSTDMCRMEVIEKVRTLLENFEKCTELVPASNRLRQKLTEDEQKNKKIAEKLHQVNVKILESHTTCATTAMSINKMLKHFKTSCFEELLKFINTGLHRQVTEVVNIILEKGQTHVGFGELTRDSLDACFTVMFDNEELPVVEFITCEVPPVSVERNENSYASISKAICDKIMIEKTLKVKLFQQTQKQINTLACSFEYLDKNFTTQSPPDLIQSLRTYGTAYFHLFATKWQVNKLDIEITIYSAIIALDLSLLPEFSNEQSLGNCDSLFTLKHIFETSKILMFGGNIQDRENGMDIHPVILVCTRHIRRLGIGSQGLFRVNGGQNRVKRLMACLEAGVDYFDSSVNTYASTLKTYFRDLKSPPISLEIFEEIFPLINTPEENVEKIQRILLDLDSTAWLRLRYKFHLLADVANHSDVGNMNAKNLSSVFGMLYCSYFRNEPKIHKTVSSVLEFFISHVFLVFPTHVGGICYPQGLDYVTISDYQEETLRRMSSSYRKRSGDDLHLLQRLHSSRSTRGL